MDDSEREELRASLGLPRNYVEDPNQSKFKVRYEKLIEDLPFDELGKYAFVGATWPAAIFYYSPTIVSAIVFETIAWLLMIFQGWPIYFVAGFALLIVAVVHEDFKQINRYARITFWVACAMALIYFIYPFDVKSHQREIKATSNFITEVYFPTFEKEIDNPKVYVDSNFVSSRAEIYDSFIVKTDFLKEFRETCVVALAAAKDGSGKLLWKTRYDKIEFVFSSGDSIPYTNCDDFTVDPVGKLSFEVKQTWSQKNSVDVWGRFDFASDPFSDEPAPSGTQVEVLFAELTDPQNFKVVATFELQKTWWGEVTIPLNTPMLGKLHLKAQNGLPETFSEVFEVREE
jgi:hypothetical protein